MEAPKDQQRGRQSQGKPEDKLSPKISTRPHSKSTPRQAKKQPRIIHSIARHYTPKRPQRPKTTSSIHHRSRTQTVSIGYTITRHTASERPPFQGQPMALTVGFAPRPRHWDPARGSNVTKIVCEFNPSHESESTGKASNATQPLGARSLSQNTRGGLIVARKALRHGKYGDQRLPGSGKIHLQEEPRYHASLTHTEQPKFSPEVYFSLLLLTHT